MVKNSCYVLSHRIFYLVMIASVLLWFGVLSHQRFIWQKLVDVFKQPKLVSSSVLKPSYLEPIFISSVPFFRDSATYQRLYPIFLKKADAKILNPYDDDYDLQWVVLDKVVVLPTMHANKALG